ncbi:hypothetical protein IW261DRAFT_1359283 [Armillaria novae-zelandiae]|uniref:DUF6534 domain-containing protein n=1 Tax=Armillaria novae-zelandiae TaxID=153914 RepID=A0AA39TFP9_9AGAR|nr:hypothetical protein IW261DRAFT_1359283 [Armillaria novae-zelandiae]
MHPVPVGYPIARLSGPTIVASLLHWGLFGTLSIQLYLYYLAFPKDRKFTKYLVYGIYILEFVQTMLVTYDVFATLGYGFGDFDALTRMYFNWLIVPIMSGIVAFVGQVFYAYRVFILSKSRTVPILITCVSLTNFVAAIITGVFCLQAGNVTKINNRKIFITFGIWCGASALCDVIIAICMTYYLMRSNAGFRQTRILVTKLIRLIIETGTVTALVVLVTCILFLVFPHEAFYRVPALIVPKLYANSVLVVLNSRFRIMGGRDTYTSATDVTITSTMIRDMTASQSTEGTPVDGMQGRVSMVTIPSKEVFNDGHEMGRMPEKL